MLGLFRGAKNRALTYLVSAGVLASSFLGVSAFSHSPRNFPGKLEQKIMEVDPDLNKAYHVYKSTNGNVSSENPIIEINFAYDLNSLGEYFPPEMGFIEIAYNWRLNQKEYPENSLKFSFYGPDWVQEDAITLDNSNYQGFCSFGPEVFPDGPFDALEGGYGIRVENMSPEVGGVEFENLQILLYYHDLSELTCHFPFSGISYNTKKLLILAHGWNPGNFPFETIYEDLAQEHNLDFSLIDDLKERASDWGFIKYNWAEDAATGDILFDGEGNILSVDNPKQAVAAAVLHGYNLGVKASRVFDDLEKCHIIGSSAGAWVAMNAIKYLHSTHPNVEFQLTVLDPYTPKYSFYDKPQSTDLDSQNLSAGNGNFETTLFFEEIAKLDRVTCESYWAHWNWDLDDFPDTPSSSFKGWNNYPNIDRRLDDSNPAPLFEDSMDSHVGPTQWYLKTLEAVLEGRSEELQDESNFGMKIGFANSLLYKEGLFLEPTPTPFHSQRYEYCGLTFSRDLEDEYPNEPIGVTSIFHDDEAREMCLRIMLHDVYKTRVYNPLINLKVCFLDPGGYERPDYNLSSQIPDPRESGANYWEGVSLAVHQGEFVENGINFFADPGEWWWRVLIDEGGGYICVDSGPLFAFLRNSPTYTPQPTNTFTKTPSPTPSRSKTPTPSRTYTPQPTNTFTKTPTPSFTPRPTDSKSPTPTRTPKKLEKHVLDLFYFSQEQWMRTANETTYSQDYLYDMLEDWGERQ